MNINIFISKFNLWANFLNCCYNNRGNILRPVKRITLWLCVACFEKFSLLKVGTAVNYFGFVKIHLVKILNHMLVDLGIGVSSLDSLFVFLISFLRVPAGFAYIYLVTIFARDLINNVSFSFSNGQNIEGK